MSKVEIVAHIKLPSELVAEVDRLAKLHGVSRSLVIRKLTEGRLRDVLLDPSKLFAVPTESA